MLLAREVSPWTWVNLKSLKEDPVVFWHCFYLCVLFLPKFLPVGGIFWWIFFKTVTILKSQMVQLQDVKEQSQHDPLEDGKKERTFGLTMDHTFNVGVFSNAALTWKNALRRHTHSVKVPKRLMQSFQSLSLSLCLFVCVSTYRIYVSLYLSTFPSICLSIHRYRSSIELPRIPRRVTLLPNRVYTFSLTVPGMRQPLQAVVHWEVFILQRLTDVLWMWTKTKTPSGSPTGFAVWWLLLKGI